MGYMLAMGPCIACKRVFTFNPHKVPSTSVVTGEREPVCADCIVRWNGIRKERGMEPIVPLPGAYEPGPEDELG